MRATVKQIGLISEWRHQRERKREREEGRGVAVEDGDGYWGQPGNKVLS